MNNNLVVRKLTPKIGAEITGINLSKQIYDNDYEKIYEALIKNKVIFFRNQIISSKIHLIFAKNFGDIEPSHPVYPNVLDFNEIVLLKNTLHLSSPDQD